MTRPPTAPSIFFVVLIELVLSTVDEGPRLMHLAFDPARHEPGRYGIRHLVLGLHGFPEPVVPCHLEGASIPQKVLAVLRLR